MADAMRIGLSESIAEDLRKHVEKIRGGAYRQSAFAAITVLYNEMEIRVPVKSGTLKDSLYRFHDDRKSSDNRQVFVVGPNKVKAPHWHFPEYGTVNMPAQPYIRPTYDAKIHEALAAGLREMKIIIKDLV